MPYASTNTIFDEITRTWYVDKSSRSRRRKYGLSGRKPTKDPSRGFLLFSQVFIDKGAKELNWRIHGKTVNGRKPIPFSFEEWLRDSDRMAYTLGSSEREEVVNIMFMVGATRNCPVGVLKEELYSYFGIDVCLSGEIQGLIDGGYFCEKVIAGVSVIFPTEKLFRQIIRRRKEYRKMYGLKDPAAN